MALDAADDNLASSTSPKSLPKAAGGGMAPDAADEPLLDFDTMADTMMKARIEVLRGGVQALDDAQGEMIAAAGCLDNVSEHEAAGGGLEPPEEDVVRDDIRRRWRLAIGCVLYSCRADVLFDDGRSALKISEACRRLFGDMPGRVATPPSTQRLPLQFLCLLQLGREEIESKATTGHTLLDEKSLFASRCTCRIAAGLKQKQAAFTFGNFTQSVSHPHAARARPPRASRPRGGRKHR